MLEFLKNLFKPKLLAPLSVENLLREMDRRQKLQEEVEQSRLVLQRDVEQRTSELGKATRQLKRLARIVGSAHDAIIGMEADGILFAWNNAATQLFGFTAEEVVGRSITTISAGSSEQLWQELANVLQEKADANQIEMQCIRKDGASVTVWLTFSALHDSEGSMDGFSVIARDITDRKTAEVRLTQSLHDKELLLKEIHHRVKNNLQVICSLLRLQSAYLEAGPAKVMFQESEERVRAMALVHDKLYRTDGLNRINFRGYVEELATQLFRTYSVGNSKVELQVDVKDTELTIEQAIPCGLILSELISNALKYAYRHRGTGQLEILMKREGKNIILLVADDGPGLPETVNFENPKTLGLRVVKTLCEQLDASLSVGREGGSRFTIEFTVADHPKSPGA